MVGPNTEGRPAAILGRHFQDQIILLCVRWYLRYASHCEIWKSSWRNGVCVWTIPPSDDGRSGMPRNCKRECAAVGSAGPMKLMFV
jgi:hypothetical protein